MVPLGGQGVGRCVDVAVVRAELTWCPLGLLRWKKSHLLGHLETLDLGFWQEERL